MKRLIFIIAALATTGLLFALPRGYKDLTLGMSLASAEDALKSNSAFGFDSERDVSLIPEGKRTLIETNASTVPYSFFTKAYLQFSDDNLYILTLDLDTSKLDYYSVLSSLEAKYGEPKDFAPSLVVWEDESTSIALERPLTLKYTDVRTREDLSSKAHSDATIEEELTSDFLDSL